MREPGEASEPEHDPSPFTEGEGGAAEVMRLRTFFTIQVLFLLLSPLAGGFHYAVWSMMDTALLLLGIGISALALVLETQAARRFVIRVAVALYVLGIVDMSINVLLSGVLGWRGVGGGYR
jgi:hypothetical protein